VILPQFLLCGLITPTSSMAGWLDGVSRVLPLRYAIDGMARLTRSATVSPTVWWDLGVIAGCAVIALVVGSTTLRRTTA
jgi:ABC-2 type transport system permease protein